MGDLIAGRRPPPMPGRSDVYDRMASFLRIPRPALEASALAERAARPAVRRTGTSPAVSEALLALCEPETARELERRRAQDGGAQLARVFHRLLEVVQGQARRLVGQELGMRVAAVGKGSTYADLRVTLLEFLDVTPETLTLTQLTEQIVPRVGRWDVDLEHDVVRVVLRPTEPRDSGRRRPQSRRGFQPRD
jgi:hypothetical protein